MNRVHRPLLAAAFLFLTSCSIGCTHIQLRNNTLHQAQAAHALQQRQVLDNLAMFVVDPNALPYFSVVGGGESSITDSGSINTALNFMRSGFDSLGFDFGASRLAQEGFALMPINDPDKLARMRCAYQAAVGWNDPRCIDCCKLEEAWGKKRWNGKDEVNCQDDCSPAPGWYCVGCRKDVPKCALYVGNFKHTYVWVTPEGTDEFSRLTLAILDYATGSINAPPAEKTKIQKTTEYVYTNDKLVKTTETTEEVAAAATQAKNPPAVPKAIPGDPSAAIAPPIPQSSQMAPPVTRENYFFQPRLPQITVPAR